ncbi:MAG TPA: hypothetical protein VK356_06200, partial [Thermomicrobiales bacterium]|nr:hypothetical protein [Thermomicrobiales bacterium]
MTQRVDINLKTASSGSLGTASAPHPAAANVPDYALPALPTVDAKLLLKQQHSLWGDAWRQFRKHKLAMAGLVLFIFMLLATFVGSPLYPQEIDEIDFSVSGSGVSWEHPFGTDSLGRDMLARMLWGGRISLAVGIVAALVAILLGTTIGAIAGFFGGLADTLLMRLTDLFISLPQVPLLLVISFLYKQAFYDFFQRRTGSGVTGIFILIVMVIG